MMPLRLLSVTTNQRCVRGLLKMASVLHFTDSSAPSRPARELQGFPHQDPLVERRMDGSSGVTKHLDPVVFYTADTNSTVKTSTQAIVTGISDIKSETNYKHIV